MKTGWWWMGVLVWGAVWGVLRAEDGGEEEGKDAQAIQEMAWADAMEVYVEATPERRWREQRWERELMPVAAEEKEVWEWRQPLFFFEEMHYEFLVGSPEKMGVEIIDSHGVVISDLKMEEVVSDRETDVSGPENKTLQRFSFRPLTSGMFYLSFRAVAEKPTWFRFTYSYY